MLRVPCVPVLGETARRTRLASAVAIVFGALVLVPAAWADRAQERALAERYAPVVRLVSHTRLRPGKPYLPIDVNLLFGEPTVALRGPWGPGDLVKIGPTAKDLSKGLFEYHLDFPGNALQPGCDYLRWERRLVEGHAPAVYAHIATDPERPGKLALQYWLFYVFNDWNNLHEGDWEMIQLVFDASTAAQALRAAAARGRLQPARGRGARGVDRREARAGRRDPPGRAPGRGVARELLRRVALPRQLGRAGRRLRRHARTDIRRPPNRAHHPERRRTGGSGLPVDRASRVAGESCGPRSSTVRPGRT